MAHKSTKSSGAGKSQKPYPDFPLTPHPSGRWCKKIRGKLHYFGKIDDPDKALAKFHHDWTWLKDGRTPPPIDTGDGCTVRLLCNAFLTSKSAAVESGELSARSFRDYFTTCEILISQLGKERRIDDLRPDDFERMRSALAKNWSAVTLKNEINRVRVVFKYAFDQRLIGQPVHYGQSFNRPAARVLRKARHEAGTKLFTAAELKRILKAADKQLLAMILLGLNCGFGNSDCATLPESALDLAGGWIDFPRPKTGIARRVPLWPETIRALRKALSIRPQAKSRADRGLVFLTTHGTRWVRVQPKRVDPSEVAPIVPEDRNAVMVAIDALSPRFRKMLDSLDINGNRGFYSLRHNFETWAGESKDQVAVNAIMGHVDSSMAGVYRETISDERLKAVVETVHRLAFRTETRV